MFAEASTVLGSHGYNSGSFRFMAGSARFAAGLLGVGLLEVCLTSLSYAQGTTSASGACEELVRGVGTARPIHRRTKDVIGPDKKTLAFADIDFSIESGPLNSQGQRVPKCMVTYRLMIVENAGKPRELKRYSEERWGCAGVTIAGYSPDGSKVAADFWWMPGDYTSLPRPVVADITTGVVRMRDLDDRITKLLPGCDYTQEVSSVTNGGEVVIRIPKSRFNGGGCPSRGSWLFNLSTGEVHRLVSKRP